MKVARYVLTNFFVDKNLVKSLLMFWPWLHTVIFYKNCLTLTWVWIFSISKWNRANLKQTFPVNMCFYFPLSLETKSSWIKLTPQKWGWWFLQEWFFWKTVYPLVCYIFCHMPARDFSGKRFLWFSTTALSTKEL